MMAPVPLGLGVTWFRDPAPRVAIIAKVGFLIDLTAAGGPRLDLSPNEPVVVPGVDLVPRKARVDVLVTGDAHAAMPSPTIPIEIAVGTTFRKRAGAVAPGGAPATRAPLRGLGPVPVSMPLAPAHGAREAAFSAGWVDIAQEGLQVAAVDQQLFEALIYGTPISLFNLSPGGGIVSLRTPSFTPYALLVQGARLGGAHRVAMRCDTLHVDASTGTIELTFRGEVEVERFATPPEAVVGLLSGRAQPTAADLEAALAHGPTRPMVSLDAAPPTSLRGLRETQGIGARTKASTLPFAAAGASQPPAAPQPPTMPPPPAELRPQSFPPGIRPTRPPAETLMDPLAAAAAPQRDDALPFVRTPATSRMSVSAPSPAQRPPASTVPMSPTVLGGWRLEGVVITRADRVMHDAVHGALGIRGRVSVLDRRFASDAERARQFRQQAELRLRVVHPGVVPMLDRGETVDGLPYVVDSLPFGQSLDALLRAGGFPGSPADGERIFGMVAETVAAIHAAGLVHASLTPHAIFVHGARVTLGPPVALGEPRRALAPLGAADIDLSMASPEVARGAWPEVDARADVWSLAALYVLLTTGNPAPRTAAWTGLGGVISDAMTAEVLESSLAEDRARRPADARALSRALVAVRRVLALTGPPRDDEDEDGPPTLDPRGTLPLISDGTLLVGVSPAGSPPAVSSDEDDERATIPPAPRAPTAPPTPEAVGTGTVFGSPSPTRSAALPFRAPPSSNTAIHASPDDPGALDFDDDTNEPATERPPPPDMEDHTADALPRHDTATFEAIPDIGNATVYGVTNPLASALPFGGRPSTPAARTSSRGGTPWDQAPPERASASGTEPPPAPASAPERGGTMPPPLAVGLAGVVVPPVTDALSLARSFGLGGEVEPGRVPSGGPSTAARRTSPPFGAAADAELDPKLVARVLSTPLEARAAVRGASGLSSLEWELGLDAWVRTIDDELASERTEALSRLLSALHENALVRRLDAR
jgi:hypothetical protein